MDMELKGVRQRGKDKRQDKGAIVDMGALFHDLGLTVLTRAPESVLKCCWDDSFKLEHSVGWPRDRNARTALTECGGSFRKVEMLE